MSLCFLAAEAKRADRTWDLGGFATWVCLKIEELRLRRF